MGVDRAVDHRERHASRAAPELDRRIDVLPALFRRLRRHHRPDERRGHPQRGRRVPHRQVRRPDHHRTEVGPGRQEHRRRDPGHATSTMPASSRTAATWSIPTRRTRWCSTAFERGRHHPLCPPQPARCHRARARPSRSARPSMGEVARLRKLGLQADLAQDRLLRHGGPGAWRSASPPTPSSTC